LKIKEINNYDKRIRRQITQFEKLHNENIKLKKNIRRQLGQPPLVSILLGSTDVQEAVLVKRKSEAYIYAQENMAFCSVCRRHDRP